MEKILSIIIPSYNMEEYLGKCLDSIIIPSIEKVDILIINDGSKDKTSEIAHEYEQRFPHSIRVIDKENGNYGSCINRGLTEAKGKYVKVLDADDTFDTANFEKFIKFLDSVDVDLVISNYDIVDKEGKVTREIRFVKYFKGCHNNVDEFLKIPTGIFQMHGITYRLANLLDINYKQTEGISYTDQEWMFLPMAFIKTYAFIELTVYKYLIGREGQTVLEDLETRFNTLFFIINGLLATEKRISIFNNYNSVNIKYLRNRLAHIISNIYKTILLYNCTYNLLYKIIEFDENLKKESPIIWEKISEIKFKRKIQFKYIKYWRRRGYNYDTFLLKKLRYFLNKYHSILK